MKLVILSIVLCFSFLHAQEVNQDDPNLQIGMNGAIKDTDADIATMDTVHKNALAEKGIQSSSNCPDCAFAQQLSAHELNAVELGAVPGTYGAEKVDSAESAAEQK